MSIYIYCLKCGKEATEASMHTKEPVCRAHTQNRWRVEYINIPTIAQINDAVLQANAAPGLDDIPF